MAPGRLKAAALEGRDPLLTMSFPGWQLGSPSGNSSKRKALQRTFSSPSSAPLSADQGCSRGNEQVLPGSFGLGEHQAGGCECSASPASAGPPAPVSADMGLMSLCPSPGVALFLAEFSVAGRTDLLRCY